MLSGTCQARSIVMPANQVSDRDGSGEEPERGLEEEQPMLSFNTSTAPGDQCGGTPINRPNLSLAILLPPPPPPLTSFDGMGRG